MDKGENSADLLLCSLQMMCLYQTLAPRGPVSKCGAIVPIRKTIYCSLQVGSHLLCLLPHNQEEKDCAELHSPCSSPRRETPVKSLSSFFPKFYQSPWHSILAPYNSHLTVINEHSFNQQNWDCEIRTEVLYTGEGKIEWKIDRHICSAVLGVGGGVVWAIIRSWDCARLQQVRCSQPLTSDTTVTKSEHNYSAGKFREYVQMSRVICLGCLLVNCLPKTHIKIILKPPINTVCVCVCVGWSVFVLNTFRSELT